MPSSKSTRQPLGAVNPNTKYPITSSVHTIDFPLKPTADPTTTASSKRKAVEEPEESDSENEAIYITQTCGQVRRKINDFLSSGEMKKGEFCTAIGCSNNAVNRFLAQTGASNGSGSNVYVNAFRFFQKREAKGIKVTKKRVKKGEAKTADVGDIKLDGEESNSVPVFDTCDEVRKKIREYLKDPNVTQAGFLREIAQTYIDGRKIQSKVLSDFLGKKGATAGNTSSAYYASYVFFEKIRVKEQKEKSKHRQEMEKIYSREGGVDTKTRHDHGYICRFDEIPVEDQYGRITFSRRR